MNRRKVSEYGYYQFFRDVESKYARLLIPRFVYPFTKIIADKLKLLLILPFLSFFNCIYGQTADHIIGKWESSNKDLVFEVYKSNNSYGAKIIRSGSPTDVGKKIAWDLKFDESEKEWSEGYVQKPGMHHPASCFITLNDDNTMTVTGYHGVRFIGKSEKYFRKDK